MINFFIRNITILNWWHTRQALFSHTLSASPTHSSTHLNLSLAFVVTLETDLKIFKTVEGSKFKAIKNIHVTHLGYKS